MRGVYNTQHTRTNRHKHLSVNIYMFACVNLCTSDRERDRACVLVGYTVSIMHFDLQSDNSKVRIFECEFIRYFNSLSPQLMCSWPLLSLLMAQAFLTRGRQPFTVIKNSFFFGLVQIMRFTRRIQNHISGLELDTVLVFRDRLP